MIKVKKLILIIICVILVLTTSTYAAGFVLTANITKKTLYAGEEFTVTLKLADIDSQNKIYGIQGKLDYDDSAIESIRFEGLNDWNVTYNDSDESELKGTFVLFNLSEGTNIDKEVAKLYIKMKSNIEYNDTQINITDVQTSSGTEQLKAPDTIIDIEILKKEDNSSKDKLTSNTANKGNNQSAKDKSKNRGSVKSNTSNKNQNSKESSANVIKKESTPNLGVEDNILPIIVILIFVSIIFFLKYKKYQKF